MSAFRTLAAVTLATIASIGLAACGGSGGGSNAPVTPATEFWVDAQNGNDVDAGTQAQPFKTLTHALAAAGAGATLHVLPGTYDTANGETFPLQTLPGQVLLGDLANRGMGMPATRIEGEALLMNGHSASIYMAEGTRIAGFEMSGTGTVLTHFFVYAQGAGVEVDQNTVAGPTYAGVHSNGFADGNIHHNDFYSTSYATYIRNTAGAYTVANNTFHTQTIPVDIQNVPSTFVIADNLFIGSGQNGIGIQSGSPTIEGNTFNNPTGYTTYGAIYAQSASSTPIVRGNTFICVTGVRANMGNLDLGTAIDAGDNDFSGVSGVSIQHDGTAAMSAIGNTFPNSPPTNGGDIVITNGGTVTWGTGMGEQY